jgi:hypothetical protein
MGFGPLSALTKALYGGLLGGQISAKNGVPKSHPKWPPTHSNCDLGTFWAKLRPSAKKKKITPQKNFLWHLGVFRLCPLIRALYRDYMGTVKPWVFRDLVRGRTGQNLRVMCIRWAWTHEIDHVLQLCPSARGVVSRFWIFSLENMDFSVYPAGPLGLAVFTGGGQNCPQNHLNRGRRA